MEFLQDQELSRNNTNQFVIQDMNLSPVWFYKNNRKCLSYNVLNLEKRNRG